MALSLDLTQRIVNVKWGGDVIVVFMETSAFDPQPIFDLKIIRSDDTDKPKAEFLESWHTPTWSGDTAPLKNSAYKVSANAGAFLTSTSPALSDPINGAWLNVLVFAIGEDGAESSLSDVKAATKLMAPALYITNAAQADLPSQVAPPGFLWGVETGSMVAGVSMKWKMRFGNHRDPELSPPPPPNAMVQCYPVISSHSGYAGEDIVTYTGYFLIAYRLDSKGTGRVYSASPKVTESGMQNLPAEWSVPIVTLPGPFILYGIPFVDPPPLISEDVV